MEKYCILITNEYPYYRGETFLETEIEYLAETFKKVFCFSINAREDSLRTRKVPSNVMAIPLSSVSSKKRYFVYSVCGIIAASPELVVGRHGFKNIPIEMYSRGRAQFVKDQILKQVFRVLPKRASVLIYSYWFTYQAVAAWLLKDELEKKGYRVYSISRAHGYDLYWNRNAMNYLPYQELSLKKLDGVFPCSNNGTRYLQGLFPKYKEKIETARLGTKDFGLGKTPNRNKIIFATCCFVKPLKRIKLFAEAFSLLCEKREDCYWVCIGDGNDLNETKRIIADNGVSEKVTFLGELNNQAVIQFYKENEVSYFCNVSTTEGLPVTIMEAMSFGIPVIATDVGGTGELVDQSVGMLLPVNLTAQMLCEELNTACNITMEKYKLIRDNARKKWELTASALNNYTRWNEMLCTNLE